MIAVNDRRRFTADPRRLRAFYAVVQYCPDRFRAESVNVGLVILCPSLNRLEVRLTPDNARALRLFRGDVDLDSRIEVYKQAAANGIRSLFDEGRLGDESALAKYAASRANDIRLTPPRLILIDDWEKDFSAAFNDACSDAGFRNSGEAEGRRGDD